jgi:predicted hydrolase (HD superfamily)
MSVIQNPFPRERAWELLTQYNNDIFHLQHALTVEAVMRWFANDQGFQAEADFWANAGLLHDIDFEQFPNEHCVKAAGLLREGGANDALIHAVCSHGWGICTTVKPEHRMEKILYAADELTGLIWAAAIVRPSKSVQDMEIKSVKKKFKTPAFAAGCSREIISNGAAELGWDIDTLIGKTLEAMRASETEINAGLQNLSKP